MRELSLTVLLHVIVELKSVASEIEQSEHSALCVLYKLTQQKKKCL